MEWKSAEYDNAALERKQQDFANRRINTVNDENNIDADPDGAPPAQGTPEMYIDEETAGIDIVPPHEQENIPDDTGETDNMPPDETNSQAVPDVTDDTQPAEMKRNYNVMTSAEFLEAFAKAENFADKSRGSKEIADEMSAYSQMLKKEMEAKNGEKPAPNFAQFISSYNKNYPKCTDCPKRKNNKMR